MMNRLDEVKKQLKPGSVYRRDDLTQWSNAVDRHLKVLVQDGTLEKIGAGMYYCPMLTAFGKTPPEEEHLVSVFLKDEQFLITTPNAYNSLGVGTTQLYNTRIVFNHKRHGEFNLGGRMFEFRMKPKFPQAITPEFLLVDLVNNINSLAEDVEEIMRKVPMAARKMNRENLRQSVLNYGKIKTKKLFASYLWVMGCALWVMSYEL